jgi:GNAT superfamily N-acetyltransferase
MSNNNPSFSIRFAKINDTDLILSFIKKLAIYERMEDEVIATVEGIRNSIFIAKDAEVIIAEENSHAIGFALFYKTYSTFLGKANYYLEDLFIDEDKRGKGYGKKILSFISDIAVKRGADRLEWVCLNWNTPALTFYQKIGAYPLDDWKTLRLSGESLKKLAKQTKS